MIACYFCSYSDILAKTFNVFILSIHLTDGFISTFMLLKFYSSLVSYPSVLLLQNGSKSEESFLLSLQGYFFLAVETSRLLCWRQEDENFAVGLLFLAAGSSSFNLPASSLFLSSMTVFARLDLIQEGTLCSEGVFLALMSDCADFLPCREVKLTNQVGCKLLSFLRFYQAGYHWFFRPTSAGWSCLQPETRASLINCTLFIDNKTESHLSSLKNNPPFGKFELQCRYIPPFFPPNSNLIIGFIRNNIVIAMNNLIKFKTEFDVHAKYNERGLHEAKKEVYKEEIHAVNSIQTITEKAFPLKPLEIGFIQSLALKDDPKFKEIQKIYTKYNADVLEQGQHAVPGLHLKTVVMDSMLKFIRLMLLAPETATKKTILDIAYYWFIKHLNPKSQRKPKDALVKEIKQIVTENKLLPRDIIEKQLPSEIQKDQLYEYRVKARTCYTDIDAPSFELQNYHIHKVAYMNDKPEKTEDDEESKRRKRLLRVEFKKPNLDQYYLPPQEQPKQPEKIDAQLPAGQAPLPAEGGAIPAEGAPGDQPQPPALTAEQERMEAMMNQMGGEPQEPEQAPVEEDDDKKKGKLDPFVKVFLLKQQSQKQKREAFECPPISQLQRLKSNYKQQLQRQDDNLKGYMIDWASKRSRLKTEINRKMQSMRAFRDISAVKEPRKVEDALYKTRINQAIRDGRSYLKRQLNKEPLNAEEGLSCFSRRRVKTVAASESNPKPFSAILEQNRRVNKRQEFLDEIEDIKLKFAKQKIFTSMHAMKNGLMHPEQIGEEEKMEKVEYPTCLLSNPFFVVKKKKKKGKKKK